MADIRTSSGGYNALNIQMISVSSVSAKDFHKFSSLFSMWLHGVVLHYLNNNFNLEKRYCALLLFCEDLKLTRRTTCGMVHSYRPFEQHCALLKTKAILSPKESVNF